MNQSTFYKIILAITDAVFRIQDHPLPPFVTKLSLSSSGEISLYNGDLTKVPLHLFSIDCGLPIKTLKSNTTLNFSVFRSDIEDAFSKLAIRMGSLEIITVLLVAQLALWIQSSNYHLVVEYSADDAIRIYGIYEGANSGRINEVIIPPGALYARL